MKNFADYLLFVLACLLIVSCGVLVVKSWDEEDSEAAICQKQGAILIDSSVEGRYCYIPPTRGLKGEN